MLAQNNAALAAAAETMLEFSIDPELQYYYEKRQASIIHERVQRETVKELTVENSRLKAQYADLQSQNTDLQSQNTDLQSQNTDLQSQNTDLANEITELKRQLAAYQSQDKK